MVAAPYPGLDPDLWDLVRQMQDDPNPVPDHLRPIEDLRADMARLEAKRAPLPADIFTMDDILFHGTREVAARIYHNTSEHASATMVYFHGGGWSLGSLDGHDSVCADIAMQTGLTVVSIDYALAPEHPYPEGLEDGLAAVRALRNSGAEIWLGGDSAGANLALGTALRMRDAGDLPAKGLLLFYPALDPSCAYPSHRIHADAPYLSHDMMRRCWSDYLGSSPATVYAAPLSADLSGLPKAFIQSAELDPLADEGAALANEFRACSVPVWHDEAKGIIHGFLRFRDQSPSSAAAFKRALAALRDAAGAP